VRCALQVGYQQAADGVVAVDTITFRQGAPADAAMTLGIYDQQGRGRIGEFITRPTKVSFLARDADTLTSVTPNRDTVPPGLIVPSVLIREGGTESAPTYEVLLADALQVDSLFTQLYFLDGATTPHFRKAYTQTEIGGGTITVWDVTFPER
jgi:hypothetical protein